MNELKKEGKQERGPESGKVSAFRIVCRPWESLSLSLPERGWGTAVSVQYTRSDAEWKYHPSHEGLVKRSPDTCFYDSRLKSKFSD